MSRHITLKKNKGLTVITVILIISFSSTNIGNITAYNETININNNNYPVYNILTLTLNNATYEGLTATIITLNETTNQTQLNNELLTVIQDDLDNIVTIIDGLAELKIYEYNDTFVPGCVYVVLSPKRFEDSGIVANQTVDYIKSHRGIFWYVDEIYYDTLNLGMFGFGGPLDYLAIWIIDIATTTYNYTIVNNTLYIDYRQRDGMEAKVLKFNGTYWDYNWEFLNYYNHTVNSLNSLYFFTNFGVRFKPVNESRYVNGRNLLNKRNYTLTVTNETEIDTILADTGNLCVEIAYNNSFSWGEKLQRFFVCFVLINHYWFVYDWAVAIVSGNTNSSSLQLTPILSSVLVTIIYLIYYRKRIKKRCTSTMDSL